MKKFICLLLVIVLTFSFSACGGDKPAENAENIDLPTLFDDYDNNWIAADEKYIGRRFRVVTKVDNVYENTVNAGHFEYYPSHNENQFFEFYLEYRKDQRDTVLTFSKGDSIVFEGTLTVAAPDFYDLTFKDVVFISEVE